MTDQPAKQLTRKQKRDILRAYLGEWFTALDSQDFERFEGNLPARDERRLMLFAVDETEAGKLITYLLLRENERRDFLVVSLFDLTEIYFQRGPDHLPESLSDITSPWLFILVNNDLSTRLDDDIVAQVVRQRGRRTQHTIVILINRSQTLEATLEGMRFVACAHPGLARRAAFKGKTPDAPPHKPGYMPPPSGGDRTQ